MKSNQHPTTNRATSNKEHNTVFNKLNRDNTKHREEVCCYAQDGKDEMLKDEEIRSRKGGDVACGSGAVVNVIY